ncbi:hypothetical protein GE21DRAFT_9902 [Neurospora crassa]|uniref:Uncharacterized protein n=1 Tax=Neurospora crassa (strain ATCC 24698 / 74-OR23-1A / CBS 708.71 / DSM 1257 / FGSC 987) TaxID=367110 RepID=Q7S428_NEUCR|nr:hypothetical protein NCU09566 [Neurospora crassa OR74A]EAA30255.2 hypothetical protein NCU09566 [Neurospora crassa OR74A]KHE81558.1 hypothetical protein GE21DRAFT_9902 [Neurospora crassa]|eukprot:XP_959491.2 hypothetical protein NCU09566 [Neurospora crassa OR74A]
MDQHQQPTPPRYDQYVDPLPPTDAWACFLSARYSQRKALYQGLTATEKELVRKELRRVRYLREYFETQRLSPKPNSAPLVVLLDDSRRRWKEQAIKNSKAALAELAQPNCYHKPLLQRNRSLLLQVQQWSTQPAENQQREEELDPENYIDGLGAPDDSIDDNPSDPNYGYNGWVIVYEKGQGGMTLDHPLCHGQYPHQKISVQKLLYDIANTPLKRSEDKNQLRYFHLQANNMKWVEDAIARYYGEASGLDRQRSTITRERGMSKPTNRLSNTEKLLKRELWHGQERGGIGTHLPPHARQIRPRCAVVPSAPCAPRTHSTLGSPTSATTNTNDVVLFMPYLHWEIEKRLTRMTNVIRKTRQQKEETFYMERLNKRRGTWDSVVDKVMTARVLRQDSIPDDTFISDKSMDDAPSWRPSSRLGTYLWHAAKLFQLIDEAADWRLINDHLYGESSLHPRRTLEQYSSWTADDTTKRDRQQVVYRGTWMKNDLESIPRVVMVDQLWMWILDENTIITAFPRRWGRNKPDPSAVHRAVRDYMASVDKGQINSIYDLALIIVDECSKVIFDRTKPDLRPEVVDIFGSAISKIAEKKTESYERFGRDVKRMNTQDPLETSEELLRKSLNIKYEWSVLMEAQSVIDQLQIMQEIFTQQITIMTDFEKVLRGLGSGVPSSQLDGLTSTLERASSLLTDMKSNRDELADLEKRQAKTRTQIRELLDMKQQQSGIIEAKAGIRRADESVLQGRSIVVFTVVTIFFLPLSFFATMFGMNARELNDGHMGIGTQLLLMLFPSLGITILSLALAFSTRARSLIFGGWRSFVGGLRKPVASTHQLKEASAHTIRNFMLEKLRERDVQYGESLQELPIHEHREAPTEKRPGTWASGKFSSGSLSHLWTRRRSQ